MHAALYIAKTGLGAQDQKLTSLSNNLANVATNGFKRDRVVFEDLLYQIQRQPGANTTADTQLPNGLQLGTGVRIVGTQKIFTQGTLQTTGESMDVAINGRGFFEIQMPDGTSSYSRDGQFHLNSDGQLVNASGLSLMPQINVPENASTLTIGNDGTVTASIAGEIAPTNLGNISVVDFVNPAGLQALGANQIKSEQLHVMTDDIKRIDKANDQTRLLLFAVLMAMIVVLVAVIILILVLR
jgi:flagellar basal-body rod protein FlgG